MQINWVFNGLNKFTAFWVSVLVEAGPAQDIGRLMLPTLKMPYNKCGGSLFTLGLLLNIALVKVEDACFTGWTFLHPVKFYSHFLM